MIMTLNPPLLDVIKNNEEFVPEAFDNMGSYNHSYVQAELIYRFRRMERFSVLSELSLDTAALDDEWRKQFKEEIKPDVCLYPIRPPDFTTDILRMSDMPLLVVEILSPMQAPYRLLQKIGAYFALGVKSCWIVYPQAKTVTVYSSPNEFTAYSAGDVLDQTLDMSLPITHLFHK